MISLYPIPLTLTMRIRSSLESLCRNLVMNTCRLRELKKLSSPQRSSRIFWVFTTWLRFYEQATVRLKVSASRMPLDELLLGLTAVIRATVRLLSELWSATAVKNITGKAALGVADFTGSSYRNCGRKGKLSGFLDDMFFTFTDHHDTVSSMSNRVICDFTRPMSQMDINIVYEQNSCESTLWRRNILRLLNISVTMDFSINGPHPIGNGKVLQPEFASSYMPNIVKYMWLIREINCRKFHNLSHLRTRT